MTKSLELPSCDDRLIWDICFSYYRFPTLIAAIEVGLFNLLEKEPLTNEEITAQLSLELDGTEALTSMLSALGLLVKLEGKFYLTDVARNYLLVNSPYNWIPTLSMFRNLPVTPEGIIEALHKDRSKSKDGKVWDVFERKPELAKSITQAMHAHSLPAALGVARWGNFAEVKKMLDVAGGSGCFSIAIAMRWPNFQSTVMELPTVCKLTEEYIATYGLTERIDTKSVDMFNEVWPSGYDAVFLSNILHDWDIPKNRYLIEQSFNALPSGGQIYLHEALLNDNKDGPLTTTAFSMSMLLGTKGKQFTASELTKLLTEQNFEEIKILPTYGYYSLVIGKKNIKNDKN